MRNFSLHSFKYLLIGAFVMLTFASATTKRPYQQQKCVSLKALQVARVHLFATDDETLILQKCLDLPAIQDYFPSNADGSKQQVKVIQFPYEFSSGVSLSKFDAPVLFAGRGEFNYAEAFVNFDSLSINGAEASAVFTITYNRNSRPPSVVKISVTLQKTDGQWNVINSIQNN